MKIIKDGSISKPEKKRTCCNCKTKFSYTPNDVQQDREGLFVICPTCQKFIAV